ncbi:MAG: efflux RND transporter periplasmic adaptor subunit [Candidatus Omnitrophica bacterium]|nr:efflux RND transporter periplasmic adaptor subunit [Candidatus Omnitrophota bacterium]
MTPEQKKLDSLRIERPEKSSSGARGVLVTVILIGLLAAGGVFGWKNWPKTAEVRTIVVQETKSGGERTLLNASGYVTARREATVASKVTGKVIEVMVEEGMEVEAGQVLAKIDSSNVEQSLELAQARLASASQAVEETKANLNQAEIDLRRTTALASKGVTADADLDRDRTKVRLNTARLQRQMAEIAVAEREVEVWKQQLDDTIIRAPFAGIVTTKDAQPGEIISPMSAGGSFTRTGICTIVDMDSLEIEVDVNESYINRVEKDQPVVATLDSYPDWEIPAKVIAIIPTADRQKATVKVRVAFEELDPRILPDMSVKVAFKSGEEETERKSTVALPKSAIHQDEGRDIVWVMKEETLERRAVKVDTVMNDQATISAGLGSGEKVVTKGPDEMEEGMRVTEAER